MKAAEIKKKLARVQSKNRKSMAGILNSQPEWIWSALVMLVREKVS